MSLNMKKMINIFCLLCFFPFYFFVVLKHRNWEYIQEDIAFWRKCYHKQEEVNYKNWV